MAAERPRVFQPGALTVVFGPDGSSVYAGGAHMTMASGVLALEGKTPCVVFRKAAAGPEERTLEEETRAVLLSGNFSVIRG